MFGFRGGESGDTVARKKGYMEDAQQRWPVSHQIRPVDDQERGPAQVHRQGPLQHHRGGGQERCSDLAER